MNPAATLYPFLSPDWFTSSSKLMNGFGNVTPDKSMGNLRGNIPFIDFSYGFILDSKESTLPPIVNKTILFSFQLFLPTSV